MRAPECRFAWRLLRTISNGLDLRPRDASFAMG